MKTALQFLCLLGFISTPSAAQAQGPRLPNFGPVISQTPIQNVQATATRIRQQNELNRTINQSTQLNHQAAAATVDVAASTARGYSNLSDLAQAAPTALIPAHSAVTYIGPADSPERIRNLKWEANYLLNQMHAVNMSIFTTALSMGSEFIAYREIPPGVNSADLSGSTIEDTAREGERLYARFIEVVATLRELTHAAEREEAVRATIYGSSGSRDYSVNVSHGSAHGQNYSSNQEQTYHTETIQLTSWELRPQRVGFDSNGNAVMRNTWTKETKKKKVLVEDHK
jgi:hypothetical protein